jgi:ABC-type multidrug transport system ATPase subunit
MRPSETEPVIAAEGIVRGYGEFTALDGFSVEVPAGSVFGLLGPNGSGKSTFITMLAAMDRPSRGTLRVFGQVPRAMLRARVGTVFQENTQDPLMRVGETLTLAGRLFGVTGNVLRQRSRELLDAFGLSDRQGSSTATLSGGMRRRLEMARALLHDPDLLLLDEPTTGVDPDERRALWRTLLERERGHRTIVLATNDLVEADAVCDAVAFIRQGKVVASGTPLTLKRDLKREVLRVNWRDPTEAQLDGLRGLNGAGKVTHEGDLVHITVDDAAALVPKLFAIAPGAIRSVSIQPSPLEDAYFQHVGRRSDAPAEVAG